MGDEQDSAERLGASGAARRIERGEPEVAQARREHDEAGAVAGLAGFGESSERFALERRVALEASAEARWSYRSDETCLADVGRFA